ncbi:MAG: NAD(+) synthase [Elusimicrobiota bacterium]|jgi:NAD+ synthase (glutamine-hydrolysing)|nr:NAD(+) synthase [Elusimicrobiota bacterium]
MDKIYKQLVKGLRDFGAGAGIKRAVLGLSGGADSAVVAVLAAEAFGAGNVFGLAMPSRYTSALSNDTAAMLAGNLGINFTVQPIGPAFDLLRAQLKKDFAAGPAPLTEQNLQSRLRGVIIMAFANQLNAAALATGNRSEIYTGYCTLYGDTVGAVAPLANLYKTEVFALARHINRDMEIIPAATIARAPTAELAPNQKDSDDLLPYDQLDIIIEEYAFKKSPMAQICSKAKVSESEVRRIIKKIDGSAFKRAQLAPAIEVKK